MHEIGAFVLPVLSHPSLRYATLRAILLTSAKWKFSSRLANNKDHFTGHVKSAVRRRRYRHFHMLVMYSGDLQHLNRYVKTRDSDKLLCGRRTNGSDELARVASSKSRGLRLVSFEWAGMRVAGGLFIPGF